VEQELFTLPEHMRSPRLLVGFELVNLLVFRVILSTITASDYPCAEHRFHAEIIADITTQNVKTHNKTTHKKMDPTNKPGVNSGALEG
jgi:hypothetical protein